MTKSNSYARRIASAIKRYGLSVLSVATSLAVASLMQLSERGAPLFFLAILLSAWFGGTGPGLLAALLATLAFDYFFLPPIHTLRVDPNYLYDLLVFGVSAVLVGSWSVARKRAETLLRQARDEQEAKVRERTADLKQANEKLQAEIAERRRVEETLRERASLLDLTHDTVFARGMDDVITYWNRGAQELYGWTSEETVGRTSHDLLRTIFPAAHQSPPAVRRQPFHPRAPGPRRRSRRRPLPEVQPAVRHALASTPGVTREVLNTSSKGYMRRLKRLGRNVIEPGLVPAWTLLASHSSVLALDPSLEVSEGAAARLGINRTTLPSRMKKLGIDPKQFSWPRHGRAPKDSE